MTYSFGNVNAGNAAMNSQQQPNARISNAVPSEPTVSARLMELLGYLEDLGTIQRSQREVLFPPEPCDPVGMSTEKSPHEPSIEQLAAMCCERAALLVSEARSIRSRL